MDGRVSIIIPTRDAAETIASTLAALADPDGELVREVIVVDADSSDGTAPLALGTGAAVVSGPVGRGPQLRRGGERAAGGWLLFVHADSSLDPAWRAIVARHIDDPENLYCAGYFRHALDDAAPAARWLEAVVAWRSRALGLPYGDQGLLISRALYDRIGGFRPLALMEDVDIARRIGRRRLAALDCRAVTSAARYRKSGYLPRSLRNLGCLALYFLGVPPRLIARIYG